MEQQTILIVDDDREIVRVIAKILELEGYRTLKAYDGLEALDMLVSNVVHLIMIDIMMPKMNGLAAVMKIRETNNIPIIILSAFKIIPLIPRIFLYNTSSIYFQTMI